MNRFQPNAFEEIDIADLLPLVAELKGKGFRFIQICATALENSCDMLYAFMSPDPCDATIDGYVVNVPDGTAVPSITEFFPAAFVFENETHDLFGIDIYGINLDFHGEFYKVSQMFPMNPRAAQCEAGAEGEEAADE